MHARFLRNDGSKKNAWLTVAGSFMVYYSTCGIINSFGFFQSHYERKFDHNFSPTKVAFIGTFQLFLMNLLGSISGTLCDAFGVKYLYVGSGIGTASAFLTLSFVSTGAYWQVFLIQGIFMGVAMAFSAQPAITVVGQYFTEKRALAMGMVSAGGAVGGICFPIFFSKLLDTVGVAWTMRITAIKIIICYSTALVISTAKFKGKTLDYRARALYDFGGFMQTEYWVLCIGAFLAQLGLWVPSYYIESYCIIAYPGTHLAKYLLSTMGGLGLLGSVVGGAAGDMIGRLNVLWPTTMTLGILCLSIWLIEPSLPILIVFGCLYGFSWGQFLALLPSAIGQICPEEKLGARMGAFYSVVSIAGLLGTPIGGALSSATKAVITASERLLRRTASLDQRYGAV
ncbi:MFS general substrate transporter [Corynespora cassiicola Philippines]|uniref:MFS general substrate transporter n=1 Tax=Corynespora cassiicola Philippines TaxID=1448308 RepID=A0A2T2N5Q5_CORCC|nr:MFS general substrate transporter [Corynespora cassiicola Philippines]